MRITRKLAAIAAAVVALLPLTASAASAQSTVPPGSVAVGFGLGFPIARGECPFSDCSIVSKGLNAEGVFNVNDHVSVGILGAYGRSSANTAAGSTPVDISGSGTAIGGLFRISAPPGRARPFINMRVAHTWNRVVAEAHSQRLVDTTGVWGLAPTAGVDIETGERSALRISGGLGIGWTEGEVLHDIGVSAGMVFHLGSRRSAYHSPQMNTQSMMQQRRTERRDAVSGAAAPMPETSDVPRWDIRSDRGEVMATLAGDADDATPYLNIWCRDGDLQAAVNWQGPPYVPRGDSMTVTTAYSSMDTRNETWIVASSDAIMHTNPAILIDELSRRSVFGVDIPTDDGGTLTAVFDLTGPPDGPTSVATACSFR